MSKFHKGDLVKCKKLLPRSDNLIFAEYCYRDMRWCRVVEYIKLENREQSWFIPTKNLRKVCN